MPKSREDFLPDAGGFLDNVDGAIVDAMFAIASGDYADKVMLGKADAKPPVVLTLTVESPDLERPANQSYSVGSQDIWDIIDGGKAIVNKKSPDKHTFRKGSRATALVEAMATVLGGGDMEKGQEVFVKRDHYMTEAVFYTGFNFHWASKQLETVGGKKTSVPLPETYLGAAEPAKGKVTKASAGPAVENDELDQILIDNSPGKDDRGLKSFAVRDASIKADEAYMKAVVSGKKLKELEEAGKLTKDPTTGLYL